MNPGAVKEDMSVLESLLWTVPDELSQSGGHGRRLQRRPLDRGRGITSIGGRTQKHDSDDSYSRAGAVDVCVQISGTRHSAPGRPCRMGNTPDRYQEQNSHEGGDESASRDEDPKARSDPYWAVQLL